MTNLPAMVSPEGEVVQIITAEALLQAGGITDVGAAEAEALAAFADNVKHLNAVAKEATEIVSDELVRRHDKRGKWTTYEGPFKIVSSSPAAGTTRYDSEKLFEALRTLVENDIIDKEAADAALEWVTPPAPDPYWKQKPGGIAALKKLGAEVTAAIDACKLDVEPPKRSAKISRRAA